MDKERLNEIEQYYQHLFNYIKTGVDTPDPVSVLSQFKYFLDEERIILKKEEKEIANLALNYWRIHNWVSNTNVERKMAANSSLRQFDKYLKDQGIEIVDILGQPYDNGYAADVLGVESDENVPDERLKVIEMVRPIILQHGSVIKYGQVILGDTVKDVSINEELPPDPEKAIHILIKNIENYCSSKYKNKGISRKLRWCKIKLEKWLRRKGRMK